MGKGKNYSSSYYSPSGKKSSSSAYASSSSYSSPSYSSSYPSSYSSSSSSSSSSSLPFLFFLRRLRRFIFFCFVAVVLLRQQTGGVLAQPRGWQEVRREDEQLPGAHEPALQRQRCQVDPAEQARLHQPHAGVSLQRDRQGGRVHRVPQHEQVPRKGQRAWRRPHQDHLALSTVHDRTSSRQLGCLVQSASVAKSTASLMT